MQRNFEPMRKQVEAWQQSELTDVTMNIYGDVDTADMREAHSKIVGLALRTV